MCDHASPTPGDLTMTLSTTRPATLYGRPLNLGEPIRLHASPGGVPFRIGRHADNPLVLGRPRKHHGDADESISKTVCEIAFEDGLWGIRCLSTSHPIQLTERDRNEILRVCADPDLATRRVVVPPGARVSIPHPPVDAVGDVEAAEIASAVLARRDPKAESVTRDDVERRVYHWRGLLKDRGVECISGQQHTNDVGTQLLAWGVLAPSDLRELLT